DVAREEASSPPDVEQEREVPARVSGRVDALDHEIAHVDAISLHESAVDRARLEPVVRGVDARRLRDVEAHRALVAAPDRLAPAGRQEEGRVRKQGAYARGAARMVPVSVRAEDPRDALGIEARAHDVRDDRLRAHASTDVDERELGPAVEEVDVAVVRVGQVEAERSRPDEMDALVDLHRLSRRALPRTTDRPSRRPSIGAPTPRPAMS